MLYHVCFAMNQIDMLRDRTHFRKIGMSKAKEIPMITNWGYRWLILFVSYPNLQHSR